MGRYLELVRASRAERDARAAQADSKRIENEETVPPLPQDPDARKLQAAGFKPKISFGDRVIWERPDTGFYVSKEMALYLLDRGERLQQ